MSAMVNFVRTESTSLWLHDDVWPHPPSRLLRSLRPERPKYASVPNATTARPAKTHALLRELQPPCALSPAGGAAAPPSVVSAPVAAGGAGAGAAPADGVPNCTGSRRLFSPACTTTC